MKPSARYESQVGHLQGKHLTLYAVTLSLTTQYFWQYSYQLHYAADQSKVQKNQRWDWSGNIANILRKRTLSLKVI